MKLKYYIEFSELIEDVDVTEEQLAAIKRHTEQHLKKYISYSGARIDGFKLEFDLEVE